MTVFTVLLLSVPAETKFSPELTTSKWAKVRGLVIKPDSPAAVRLVHLASSVSPLRLNTENSLETALTGEHPTSLFNESDVPTGRRRSLCKVCPAASSNNRMTKEKKERKCFNFHYFLSAGLNTAGGTILLVTERKFLCTGGRSQRSELD